MTRGRRRHLAAAIALLLLVSLAACTAKASHSVVASPSASSEAATASPYPVWSPDNVAATPTSTYTSDETPSASPTPTPLHGPLPSVDPVPTGTWTGIQWIQIPVGHAPAVPAADEDGDNNVNLEGWSGGYVEFVWNPVKRTLTPWVSPDGLRWQEGTKLNISVWNAQFKEYDQGLNAADRADCTFEAIAFTQGPSSLLLRGDVACGGGCGGPWWSTWTMWSSTDGRSWTPVDMPSIFGSGGVGPVSGGGSGFVALGQADNAQTIWLSTNGTDWRHGSLPADATAIGAEASDPVSFAGGYVLPGVVLAAKGHGFTPPAHNPYGYIRVEGGCAMGGGTTDLSKYAPALWWSPDGTNWTPETLSGARSNYGDIEIAVTRVDDHTLVLDEQTSSTDESGTNSETQWVSTDGKAWTRLRSNPLSCSWQRCYAVSNLARGLALASNAYCVIGSSSNLVRLPETGSQPWVDSPQTALGPTGLLATGDGSRFWIGVLKAG